MFRRLDLLLAAVAVTTFATVACSDRTNVSRCPTSASSLPPSAAARTQVPSESLGDSWVGGFGPAEDGSFLRLDFTAGIARLHPRDDVAPLGIIHPSVERALSGREEVRFAIDDGKHRRAFALAHVAPDVLDGTVTDGAGAPLRARLVRLASYERKAVDSAFGGTYAVDGDPGKLVFVDDGALFDTRDGSERRLFLRSGQRALVGAGVATTYPSRGEVTVDAAGTLRLVGEPPIVAPRLDLAREDIRFESGGVTLVGTLLSPKASGPHPVVVNVHGSGRITRSDHWSNAIARVFLSRGYSVFLYDKRGVGDSSGEYVGRGARDTDNVSPENLDRLASDAAAAATMLAARKDIDATRVGLIGLSQAGWIVPLAARRSKAVRFVVLMSGPTVHTTVELAFSALVGDGDACLPIEAADHIASDHAPRTGFDPAPTLAKLDVPGLWIYGALDSSIPVQASIRVLEPLKKSHAFDVKLVPGAGHELYVVRRDIESERQLSTGLSPAAIEAIKTWLAKHVDTKPQ